MIEDVGATIVAVLVVLGVHCGSGGHFPAPNPLCRLFWVCVSPRGMLL